MGLCFSNPQCLSVLGSFREVLCPLRVRTDICRCAQRERERRKLARELSVKREQLTSVSAGLRSNGRNLNQVIGSELRVAKQPAELPVSPAEKPGWESEPEAGVQVPTDVGVCLPAPLPWLSPWRWPGQCAHRVAAWPTSWRPYSWSK